VESITFDTECQSAKKAIVNKKDTDREEVNVLVKLLKKDGQTGVETQVPVAVDFSFTPGEDNVAESDSFQSLGKKGDTNADYWKKNDKSVDFSVMNTSEGKTKARSKTKTDGGDKSKAYIDFLPSGVGGDTFTLKATVYKDGTETEDCSQESGELTVWRETKFNLYEMTGESHIANNKDHIQGRFDNAFGKCKLGEVATVQNNVKYIGLYQVDWNVTQQKQSAETPTPQEIRDAARLWNDDRRKKARSQITQKAQAWVDRIEGEYGSAKNNWKTGNLIADDSVVGIQYLHPKFNPSSGANAAQTSQWSEFGWLVINAPLGGGSKHPDGAWTMKNSMGIDTDIAGISYTSAERVSFVTKVRSDRARAVMTHEIGHASGFYFKRKKFGSGDDHSTHGLMAPQGPESHDEFTSSEIEILKGMN